MKILQVCNKPPYPPHDGGSLAMYNLASALCRQGHAITVLAMETSKHKLTAEQKSDASKNMRFKTVCVDTDTHLNNFLKNLIFSRLPYNAQRFISKEFEDTLIRILETETYDVIQLEGPYLTPYIQVIRDHSKALIALRAHNIEHEIWYRIAKVCSNPLKKLYFSILAKRIRAFELSAINRYDVLVPITQRDLEVFIRMGNHRPALVCQAGMDIGPLAEEPGNAGIDTSDASEPLLSLFFLGSLDWIPNQEGLLWFIRQVLPVAKRNYPQLTLHVAGRNAPDSLVKKLSSPGVLYHGQIEDSQRFINMHDIMVVPCFSGSGMRLKIVEAMALGKPVITTPIGAEGIAVENGKNILIAEDANNFCRHIENLVQHRELCSSIGQEAREFVACNLNNNTLAINLAEFYKACLT
jgi:polysaccharide biosynthesis protein PslH